MRTVVQVLLACTALLLAVVPACSGRGPVRDVAENRGAQEIFVPACDLLESQEVDAAMGLSLPQRRAQIESSSKPHNACQWFQAGWDPDDRMFVDLNVSNTVESTERFEELTADYNPLPGLGEHVRGDQDEDGWFSVVALTRRGALIELYGRRAGASRDDLRESGIRLIRPVLTRVEDQFPGKVSSMPQAESPPAGMDACTLVEPSDVAAEAGWTPGPAAEQELVGGFGGGLWVCEWSAGDSVPGRPYIYTRVTKDPVPDTQRPSNAKVSELPADAWFVFEPAEKSGTKSRGIIGFVGPDRRFVSIELNAAQSESDVREVLVALAKRTIEKLA